MAFCINCGQELAKGAKFCANCGETVENNSLTSQRKTVYDGELHKCPNCGELLNSFVTNCPTCGLELRNLKTNSPIEELLKKIEQTSSIDEKIEIIANFYIPNTREDIYDFFILAVSNLEDKWCDMDDAWRTKLEQAYHKARISFGNSPEFVYIEKLYTKTRKEITKREKGIAATFRRNKVACTTGLMVGGGIVMVIVGIMMFATISAEENWGGSYGGFMLLAIGINLLIAPTWALEELKKRENPNYKRRGPISKNSNVQIIGKSSIEFYYKNYDDMTEFLKSRGFRNIVTKPERKGLFNSEGAVKSISIAGNTEFGEDDEFDIDSKIIIRYYSENVKG